MRRPTSCSPSGNTTAVFQLESRGMRDLIKRARPDRFEDVIALVALYRPGPMDLIPEYIERKHGKRVEYLDPRLVPILGPTYGIMVYQEQVMQIAQVIGGYTLGGADLLRRAMGKKKPEEMALQRDIFVAGAEKNGLSKGKATQLFDLMEKFAGYGFNKSHAAAYALLAYQTAYMKAHHAAAFAAANLSAVMDDTDKVRQFHDDAVANGLKVLPPDVNASEYRFVPVDRGTVRYGLGAVRGTGQARDRDASSPRASRLRSPICSTSARRVDKRLVNRRVVEALVRAGAFDSVEANRARLLASAGRALEAAEQAEAQASQNSLFGEAEAPRGGAHAYIEAPPWDARQKLLEEKAALGFYLSGHLFSIYERELAKFPRTPLAKLSAERQGLDGRRGGLGAHADDAPRPHDGGDARRRDRAGRDLGVQRAVRAPPRQAEGGRAAHRLGQGAGRPVLRRPARARRGSARPRGAARRATARASRSR